MNNDVGEVERSFVETLQGLATQDIYNLQVAGAKVASYLEGTGNKVGLIYGKVQSGKTNCLIMSIAKANDNNFRFFVVLTSDNVSLYSQTIDRVKNGLTTLYVLGNDDLKEFDDTLGRARVAMNKKGIVLVSKKNATNLKRLQEFFRQLDVSNAKAIVFDDEADYGSLNSRINAEEKNEQSAIHSLIVNLQGMFRETKFVQVTATPQAVFLQRQGGGFRPEFVVQIDPGSGYVGGEEFFNMDSDEVVQSIQRIVETSEIESITQREDYRQSGLTAIPIGIRRAINAFLVGASLKIASGRRENFSMLCHISSRRSAHQSLHSLVHRYIQIISENIDDENKEYYKGIDEGLKLAFNDITTTFGEKIDWNTVRSIISNNIYSTNVQIIISGPNKHDPSYTVPFNILIGGDRLGRGLTIKNLIVTYYGRLSGAPKVDTMMQHSRMYGHRQRELDVMRVFSTEELFRTYHDVYVSDKEEWEYFSETNGNRLVLPVILSLEQGRSLRATRNQVIPLENVLKYFPGRAYIMYDATSENTQEIDNKLVGFKRDASYPAETTFDIIASLIESTKSSNFEQRWNAEALKKILEKMKNYSINSDESGRGNGRITPFLVVRRGRDEKKKYRAILSTDDNDIKIDNGLILFMYRLTGNIEKGWDGTPVWVPVVRFPEGNAYYFTVGYVPPSEENDADGE